MEEKKMRREGKEVREKEKGKGDKQEGERRGEEIGSGENVEKETWKETKEMNERREK